MKNKFLTAILSVFIAIVLWNYIVTVVSPGWEDTYYNIPVVLRGESILEERGLILISGQDTTVNLELSGNRQDLIKIKNSDITLIADLSRIYEAGTHALEYEILPINGVSVKSRNPSRITLQVANRKTEKIPVTVNYLGAVPEGFISDKGASVLDHEFVTVSGPEDVVGQIRQAVIEVDLTGRTESFIESYRITLCDEEGEPVDVSMVTANVAEVRLEMKIECFKTIPLVLNVVDGGGATAETTKIEIEPAELAISGSSAALDLLEQLDLGTVNLATITEATERVFDIELPVGVTNRTGISQATVKISFPGLSTKELLITEFVPINVPEGMTADILTKEMKLVFRGPAAEISGLSAADVRVMVDFTGAQAGTSTYELTLSLSSRVPNVGVLTGGDSRVSATVAPDDEKK